MTKKRVTMQLCKDQLMEIGVNSLSTSIRRPCRSDSTAFTSNTVEETVYAFKYKKFSDWKPSYTPIKGTMKKYPIKFLDWVVGWVVCYQYQM